MSMWYRVISPFLFCSFSCVIFICIVTLTADLNFSVFSFIFAVLLLLICLWFTFAVLQVSCENKSTTTHSTQFMVHTEEGSILYFYTTSVADSLIRLKVIRGFDHLEIRSHSHGHAHLGVVLWSLPRKGPSPISLPNFKRITLLVQKL